MVQEEEHITEEGGVIGVDLFDALLI